MIEIVLKELNNFFVGSKQYSEATITTDTLTIKQGNSYTTGQYVRIEGTILNDGVYQISGIAEVGDNLELTIIGLVPEEANIILSGLYIPRQLLELITEIEANGSTGTVKSESLGDYSVTYDKTGNWQDVYSRQLSVWKKVHSV